MAEGVQTYRVKAFNAATESDNRIHSDEVARQYGFSGGLVPGVTVFAYMTRPVLDAFGEDWLRHGTIGGRFLQPVYEGEEVRAEASVGDDDAGRPTAAVTVQKPDGEVAATGIATVPTESVPAPEPDTYAVAPWPAAKEPAGERSLAAGRVLGTFEVTCKPQYAEQYLEIVSDDHPLYRQGFAHPGWLLQLANLAFSQQIRLGPWIHVESDVTAFAPVMVGDRIEVRPRVADRFDRKGHRFVALDMLYVVDGRAVRHVLHTAIWEIRRASG
jgi:acyl dehydratase